MTDHSDRPANNKPSQNPDEKPLVKEYSDFANRRGPEPLAKADMTPFDKDGGPVVITGKPAKGGQILTPETSPREQQYAQERQLLREVDQLADQGANTPRQIELLRQLGKSFASSATKGYEGDRDKARYYFDRSIQLMEMPNAKEKISSQSMLGYYKETLEFYCGNNAELIGKPKPSSNLVTSVNGYLDKAIGISEQLSNQNGQGNAEQHAKLLEYAALVHQRFNTSDDHEQAILLYQRARDVRDFFKIPESKESALAIKGRADSLYPARIPTDPVPIYLDALKIAAKLPDGNSQDLFVHANGCLTAIDRAQDNPYKLVDDQQVIDNLKQIANIFEDRYGEKDPRLVPIYQKLASTCMEHGKQSSDKAKYAGAVLEKAYALQKGQDTEQRTETLRLMALAYHGEGDKNKALKSIDQMVKEAEHAYTSKDDKRLIPILSVQADLLKQFSEHGQCAEVLERMYKMQTAPDAKVPVKDRIDTLVRASEAYGHIDGQRQKAADRAQEAISLAYKNKEDPSHAASLENISRQCQLLGLHAQSASLLEKYYETPTAQHKELPERLAILQSISKEYFEAKDYEMAAKAYSRVVQMVDKNRVLVASLDLPDFVKAGIEQASDTVASKANPADEAKVTKGLYLLANQLIKAAQTLKRDELPDSMISDNYSAAANCFNKCLSRGIEGLGEKKDILNNMLITANLRFAESQLDQKRPELERIHNKTDFYNSVNKLYNQAAELLAREKLNLKPELFPVLDQIANYCEFNNKKETGLALLEQALNAAKEQKRPLPELGDRAKKLAYKQAFELKDGDTNTWKNLLKDVDDRDPKAIEALDTLADSYLKEGLHNFGSKCVLLILEKTLAMSKVQQKPPAEILQRTMKLADAQVSLGYIATAIDTKKEALKQMLSANGDKPNADTVKILHDISDYLQRMNHSPFNRFVSEDVRKMSDYLKQAAEIKKQEIAMAEQVGLTPVQKAQLKVEQGKIHLALGDEKTGLNYFREALDLDESLWKDNHLIWEMNLSLEHEKAYDQMEANLRKSIEVLQRDKKPDHWKLSVSNLALATVLDQNGKAKDAVEVINSSMQSLSGLLAAAKKDNLPIEQLNSLFYVHLDWTATHYTKQKEWALAEKNYQKLYDLVKKMPENDFSTSRLKGALLGLVTAYNGQNKKDEAAKAQKEYDQLR